MPNLYILSCRARCAAAFAALVAVFAPLSVIAQNPDAADVRAPLVLAAQAKVTNPLYRETVILVAPFGGDRHLGVIVNRPTAVALSSLFPDDAPSRSVQEPVYYGGPMSTNALVAVVKGGASPGGRSLALGPGFHLAYEREVIDQILRTRPNDGRYYVGLVIWLPGELKDELSQGYWHVSTTSPASIMQSESGRLWRDLVVRARVITASLDAQVAR